MAATLKFLGFDPWKNGYDLHKKIGVIPQEFNFFEKTTPREAIIYYADLFNVKVDPDEILKEVLLQESAKVNFDSLSGGQKQKTGLALSLVNSPDLLFLDEPTTGLDPNARRAIWEVIRSLKAKGKTIILTTHYLDEAQQLSDRVAIMDHGHIVAMGTTEEIIRQHGSGERLEIHGSQQLADYIKANTDLQVEYDSAKGEVFIPLRKKIDALAALAAAEQSGMDWGEIQTRQDSLDDVFVKLVNEKADVLRKQKLKLQKRKEGLKMVSAKRIASDFKVFSRGYLRNKFGLFFGLVFPVILILIFGAIFSGGGLER